MAIQTTVRIGGGTAATTFDYTDQILLWTLSKDGEHQSVFDAGMRFDNGGASQYQFIVVDDAGDIPKADRTKNLASHNVVLVTEDAPGYDAWLSRGRISRKDIDGGDHEWGTSRTFHVTVDDANIDLRGLAIPTPWVRDAETDVERVEAAVSAFLSGDPRATTSISSGTAHLVPNTLTVQMPAKTYPAGTDVADIIADCATTAGKIFGVVIHHVSSASHLCLLYIDDQDHDTYSSSLSISDDLDDIDNTLVFAPIWDQGPAALEDGGDDPVSLVVATYGAGTASYTTADAGTAITDSYDYWAVSYNDPISETAAQAAQRAAAQLAVHSKEHVTHQVTIKIPADLVDELCAGMSIDIKSARSMGGQYLGTTQTRRIAQLKWEAIAPEVGEVPGHYYAHMQLDRPARLAATVKPGPVGPKPPTGDCTDLTATHAPYLDGESSFPPSTVWVEGGDGLILNEGDAHSGSGFIGVASLSNPWAYYTFSGDFTSGSVYTFSIWSKVSATAAPATFTFGYDSGTSLVTDASQFESSESITISSAEADWTYHEIEWTAPSNISSSGMYNQPGVRFLIEFNNSSDGVSLDDGGLKVCSEASPPPASDDDTGDPGDPDSGEFSPADHKHPAQTASVTPITDTGGYYTGTNVEAALQEARPLVVKEVDGSPSGTATVLVVPNGTLAVSGGTATYSPSATSGLIIEEADGSPTGTATKLVVPNGSLSYSGGTATYTASAASGVVVQEADGSPSGTATVLVFPNSTLSISGGTATYTAAGGGGGGGITQAYVGYNTIGASVETLGTSWQYMKQITLANDCLLTNIEAHIKGNDSNVPFFGVGVCEDNSGEFGTLIASSYHAVNNTAFFNTTYRWFGMPIGQYLPAGTYWIGIITTAAVQIHYDTGGSDRVFGLGNYFADGDQGAQTDTTKKYSIRANTIR